MMTLLDKIPAFKNKTRVESIDECIFFLHMEGMTSDAEDKKIRLRLEKRCKKEGLVIK